MMENRRSRNLDLVRWLHRSHDSTAKLLKNVTGRSKLSKLALGQIDIDDRVARAIEDAAKLPIGWLDRDNVSAMQMSNLDYQILETVKDLPDDKKQALIVLLIDDDS